MPEISVAALQVLGGRAQTIIIKQPTFTLQELIETPTVQGSPPPDRLARYQEYLRWQLRRPSGVRVKYESVVPQERPHVPSEFAIEALAYLVEHGPTLVQDVMRALGWTERKVREMERKLAAKEYITVQEVRSDRIRHRWHLTKKGRQVVIESRTDAAD